MGNTPIVNHNMSTIVTLMVWIIKSPLIRNPHGSKDRHDVFFCFSLDLPLTGTSTYTAMLRKLLPIALILSVVFAPVIGANAALQNIAAACESQLDQDHSHSENHSHEDELVATPGESTDQNEGLSDCCPEHGLVHCVAGACDLMSADLAISETSRTIQQNVTAYYAGDGRAPSPHLRPPRPE